MAQGTIVRTRQNDAVAFAYFDSTHFEIVRNGLRVVNGIITGTLIIRCLLDVSNPTIGTMTIHPDGYQFLIGAVTASQWDYTVQSVYRVYVQSGGGVVVNTTFTAGQYLTIPFSCPTAS